MVFEKGNLESICNCFVDVLRPLLYLNTKQGPREHHITALSQTLGTESDTSV